ncbi:HGGxSTG domain-containing protein [Altererythrobacter sp. Z27]|uniref:HGGxSTG domain-containing protein n=1 Tax=Altererythrobacter sp. Z27 TaxID=3461147 RepID=UPI00404438C1
MRAKIMNGSRKKSRGHKRDELPTATDREKELASVLLPPSNSTAPIVELLNRGEWGPQSMLAFSDSIWREAEAAKRGDLGKQREMLVSQAFALHGLFTELTRRAALNLGESLGAVETYLRLARKAQAQSRATIEALERLVHGRMQTVRHVHVNEGGRQSLPIISIIMAGAPEMENATINPMQPKNLASAPRSRKGSVCQSPAVKGLRRCRMHGGVNPGRLGAIATHGSTVGDPTR